MTNGPRKLEEMTFDEIERLLSAPPPVKPPTDPAEERRKREALIRWLEEVEATLKRDETGKD